MINDFYTEYISYSNSISNTLLELTQESYQKYFKAALDAHEKQMALLSERTKTALKTLGYYGWYIPSLNHPGSYLSYLAEQLNNNNEEAVDKEMSLTIKREFKKLCKRIIDMNPKRSQILKEAFEAHKSKKYALSVLVFLSQADGICKEVTKNGLFFKDPKNRKIPKTKKYVDNLNERPLISGYLEPLRIVLPIIFSGEDIDENVKLNRHQILHGEDCNYDNELTSLKAFSLLSYINTFLQKYGRDKTGRRIEDPPIYSREK